MGGQLGYRSMSGRHRQTARGDCTGTRDIQRRVPHHQNLIPGQRSPEQLRAPALGDVRDLVSILMIVPEPSRPKLLPEMVMPQLDLRPKPDIAGQEADGGGIRKRAH